MNETRVFHRTWLLQQLPVTLKLRSLDWRFLICSDGKTTVAQIQRSLQISRDETDGIISRLCETNLLTETRLSLDDYAQNTLDTPITTSEPQTFEEYLRSSEAPETDKTKPLPAFSPLQKPAMSTPINRSMSLLAVVKFILSLDSDSTAGSWRPTRFSWESIRNCSSATVSPPCASTTTA